LATLIQLRRDTSANWVSNNPVLSSGEIGVATDFQQFKIGNSASSWNQLEYVNAIPSDYIPLSASNSFDLFGSASAAEINAKAYADTVVSNIIDSAPGALDTLNEIAAAINDDPDFFNTVATNLSTHESDTTNVHGIADTSLLATTSYVDTAESDAISSANSYSDSLASNYDSVGSASAAEFNAKAYSDSLASNYDAAGSAASASASLTEYTDSSISTHNSDSTSVHGIADTSLLATTSYVDSAESNAIATASAYSDSLATNYDSAGSASAAQTAAQSYADSLSSNYDSAGSASAALNSAKSYTDSEVANLVDSAPTTLDTLNELAAALGDDPNFATSTASAIGDRLTIAVASATYLTKSDAQSTYLPISGSVNWSNINNKPDPSITLTGDVSGSTTLTDLNSASITVTVEKDFSLTFTGDVTGSGTVNNLASASISLTVAANSIALGTDTTGNYVAGLTAGNGISITGTAGEGWSPTVSINSSTASVAFANITSKPTTLSGYGITDALSVSSSSNFLAVSASSNFAPLTILRNEQTGTSYTLVIGDAGKLIEMNNAAANTLTVPPNSSVAFPTGTKIDIVQIGAGQTTIDAGSGVTINSKDGNLNLTGQWSAATLVKRATDTWVLIGDLSA